MVPMNRMAHGRQSVLNPQQLPSSRHHFPMAPRNVLRYTIAYALRRARKVVRSLNNGLTEDERYAVADHGPLSAQGARRPFAVIR